MDICFIKLVLLWCEHGHFSINFASHGVFCTPPHTIKVKQTFIHKRICSKSYLQIIPGTCIIDTIGSCFQYDCMVYGSIQGRGSGSDRHPVVERD